MKNAKLRISAMLLLLAALLLSACGHTEGRAAQYKIYLITKSTSTEFWRSVFAGANAARAEYNVNLVIRGPDTEENYAGQNMYIQEAIRNHADAIVFSAISYTENAAAIDEAAEAGIKIVVIDSDVNSSRVSARIGTDNIQAGRITAAAALDTEEQHLSVGIVNFAQFSRNGEEREIGLREQLEKDPRVEEICTVNSASGASGDQHPDRPERAAGRRRRRSLGRTEAEGPGTRHLLRLKHPLHRAAAARRRLGTDRAEPLCHGLSRGRNRMEDPGGTELPPRSADRHGHLNHHTGKHVFRRRAEGAFLLRIRPRQGKYICLVRIAQNCPYIFDILHDGTENFQLFSQR